MWIAILTVAAIALIAGLILAVASVLLAVPRDELTDALRRELPGANCGACGYSGCDGYAAAMAKEGAPVGLCTPGGEATLKATSALLGVDGTLNRRVATVRCGGCEDKAPRAFDYHGISSCRAAVQLYGGNKGCSFGCLGYGDCAAVCEYGAFTLADGIARISEDRCRACGKCVTACPKGIITLAEPSPYTVLCHSTAKGGAVRKVCSAGCIGCMKCTKVCESGAVTVTNNLASIDPARCTGCGKCAAACPVSCIHKTTPVACRN